MTFKVVLVEFVILNYLRCLLRKYLVFVCVFSIVVDVASGSCSGIKEQLYVSARESEIKSSVLLKLTLHWGSHPPFH